MSDFFGEDFTADLKRFFLKSLQDELEQVAGAADEDTWQIFREELSVKIPDWIVDAKTNEFVFFAAWLEKFNKHLESCNVYNDFALAIDRAFAYSEDLHASLKDTEDGSKQFSLGNLSSQKQLYLHCEIGDQNFLIPVTQVLEVLGNISITPFPMKKTGFSGMIPFRGDAIPVVKLEDHGLNSSGEAQYLSFVVCENEGAKLALAVHQADKLIEISTDQMQDASEGNSVISVPFLTHFVIHENKNMMLFALERMVAA